jgi:hypothetical protein
VHCISHMDQNSKCQEFLLFSYEDEIDREKKMFLSQKTKMFWKVKKRERTQTKKKFESEMMNIKSFRKMGKR